MEIVRPFCTAVLCAALLLGCASSHDEQTGKHRNPGSETDVYERQQIPPNNCRLAATVVSIDVTLRGATTEDPCGAAPCLATIRVDSVLGYGSAFPTLLNPGQNIPVRFPFTLLATEEILPDVRPPLPGLNVGSRFEALLSATSVLGSSDPSYTIYSYRKK